MMDDHIQRLLARRAYWVAQSQMQRDSVAEQAQALIVPTLTQADRLRAALAWVRQRPWLMGVGVTTAVVLRPSRAWRWLRRGWSMWRWWQRVRPVLTQLSHTLPKA